MTELNMHNCSFEDNIDEHTDEGPFTYKHRYGRHHLKKERKRTALTAAVSEKEKKENSPKDNFRK